jgi:transaldolase
MKFWLATANIKRIEQCMQYGVFHGVITNPHVVALEKMNMKELFEGIVKIAPKTYCQIHAASIDKMLKEADEILSIDPDKILLKIPATIEGLSVINQLSSQGLSVMATIVPTTVWLTYAHAAGAHFVAPYSRMLQRRNINPKMEGVKAMQKIIDRQQYSIDLCVGIYDATQISQYASLGVKSCFVWEKDVEEFMTQSLVAEAVEGFSKDWETINQYR